MNRQHIARRFGLALSGGGFRAALYHLGVIRFLRDANMLSQVTDITSVSGGSVIGAHLALNWERYCGTDEEFQEATTELLRFLQMDVRNRIVRRFPLTAVLNTARRALRRETKRQFTRAGLLEQHYEKYLFGDTALFDLPETPHLYILATNLSEGSICAFHKGGLLLQRRSRGATQVHFEEFDTGLATVAMAVAASSAFPGFFPPLELRGKEVSAKEGEFGRHAFTDGGIYDNLGLRMFRHLQHAASCVAEGAVSGESDADAIGESEAPASTSGGNGPRRGLTAVLQQLSDPPLAADGPKELDTVLVSDAGASFKVRSDGRAGGLFSTALRSSEILMNRVNQLELESFVGTQGVLFLPITRFVQPQDDPTALHPEIQRQAALMRTDMDRFSDLEISALVRHGYCVARQTCRENALVAPDDIAHDPPWDPLESRGESSGVQASPINDPKQTLATARVLQASAVRRTLGSLFSLRDWPTYVWLLLIAVVLLAVPYEVFTTRRTAVRQGYVLDAVKATSPLYRDVLQLLRDGPTSSLAEIAFEDVDSIEPLDFTGYQVVTDNRIYDLRGWTSTGANEIPPFMHARFRMRRTAEAKDRPTLRIQLPSDEEMMRVEYLPKALRPAHVRAHLDSGAYLFETSLDFSHVPIGTDTNLIVRQMMPRNMASQDAEGGRFKFTIAAETSLVRIWVLLPEGRDHNQFVLNRFPLHEPDLVESVQATTTVELPIGSIATFQLVNPQNNYRYECRWRWRDADAD